MYPPIDPLLTIVGPPSCIGCPGTPLPRSSVLPCASRRCTTLFLARAAPTFRPMRPASPPAFFAGGAAESDIYKQQHCDCLPVARRRAVQGLCGSLALLCSIVGIPTVNTNMSERNTTKRLDCSRGWCCSTILAFCLGINTLCGRNETVQKFPFAVGASWQARTVGRRVRKCAQP